MAATWKPQAGLNLHLGYNPKCALLTAHVRWGCEDCVYVEK